MRLSFLNLNRTVSEWASKCSVPACMTDQRRYRAFIGRTQQDGAKFRAAFDRNTRQEQFVIIKTEWLPELRAALMAWDGET
jgi:hypothetical protein